MIDGRNLAAVRDALTLASTTEADFRNAGVSVANQVDANEEELKAPKMFMLTGDVTSLAIPFMLNDDTVVIPTIFGDMVIMSDDIFPGAVNGTHIANGSVSNLQIAGASKLRFQVLDSGGMEIFAVDGLIPTTP